MCLAIRFATALNLPLSTNSALIIVDITRLVQGYFMLAIVLLCKRSLCRTTSGVCNGVQIYFNVPTSVGKFYGTWREWFE